MVKYAIWAEVKAKAGKEQQVAEFLKSALPLAQQEPLTVTWYVVNLGPGVFGIFDTFNDEAGREAHLTGEIAKALFSEETKALLDGEPRVHKLEILAAKTPGN